MLLYKVLSWLLPALTLALVVFAVYWFRLFAELGQYSNWKNRPKRRRRWRRF
jgi:hypothetical protein